MMYVYRCRCFERTSGNHRNTYTISYRYIATNKWIHHIQLHSSRRETTVSIMNDRENITILITRMERLLASVTNKMRDKIKKLDICNSRLFREIIDLIELLKKFVISRMKRTLETKRVHIIGLHDCQIKVAETEFQALQETFKEQNLNSEIFLKDIITCINDEEEIMRSIRETSEVKILREIEESAQKMLIIREQNKARKKILWSEIDCAQYKLHNVVISNTTSEKKLFDICTEIEQKYIALLAKYDNDIGTSYVLKEELLEENKMIKARVKEMKDQLEVQRELYARFKKEREIAMMKAFMEKLELFRRNQAAKIIQRSWRVYFERITLKKRRRLKRK